VSLADTLGAVIRIPGVRGALIVSTDDGLVVAESLMEGVDGRAVAALTGSVAARMFGLTGALGAPSPTWLHVQAADGALLGAWGPSGLLVVAVTAPDVNAGQVRLELLQAAERAA
jgi:predicted regulator of Ras-like GTPase activity (Roadblock/LC7/MglB family)